MAVLDRKAAQEAVERLSTMESISKTPRISLKKFINSNFDILQKHVNEGETKKEIYEFLINKCNLSISSYEYFVHTWKKCTQERFLQKSTGLSIPKKSNISFSEGSTNIAKKVELEEEDKKKREIQDLTSIKTVAKETAIPEYNETSLEVRNRLFPPKTPSEQTVIETLPDGRKVYLDENGRKTFDIWTPEEKKTQRR